MPHTWLVFVWHMHQPFYKDLGTGEYQLPWTRMHALKDYYGMVQMLEEFPQIRQTFNLVPSMMVQIEEYASGQARDPFLRLALKPAEDLAPVEQEFILKYFFQAHPGRIIHRFRRYGEIYEAWRAVHGNSDHMRRSLGIPGMRDLQVLSQLAWFDEILLENDADIRMLAEKGRDYSLDDQALLGRKQRELCGMVLPAYRRLAQKGQIEISVTPFYHPILPLLCDSNIASVSHPGVPLPRTFKCPQDARHQIVTAREFAMDRFGSYPPGMWPSEGSVSDDVLELAASLGVRWMATDNGVLGATLNTLAGVRETFRPYVWRQGGREMRLIFRDHFLSDLIGFVYSRMDASAAAHHFLDRIRENSRLLHAEDRDALVPIILDGENAWEHYDRNGRPFLKELYGLISEDSSISAVTVSEALAQVPAGDLDHIHPGSWINANLDIWIGAQEDNRAWELLLDAREAYDRVALGSQGALISEAQKQLAFEGLMIAEGSDWCWWYGPEHHSENRPEFDKLFRDHLAQVYRSLNLSPPDSLCRPIISAPVPVSHEPPSGPIEPRIDGEVSSYFEWLGAGLYRPDPRHGAMHGKARTLSELRYGSNGSSLFLRLDFDPSTPPDHDGSELRLTFKTPRGECEFHFSLGSEGVSLASSSASGKRHPLPRVSCACVKVFELSAELKSLGATPSDSIALQLSLWSEGLPQESLPVQGWIEFVPEEWRS